MIDGKSEEESRKQINLAFRLKYKEEKKIL